MILRRERQARGISQARLAAAIGADQATVSRLERGRGTLALEDVVATAKLLGVDVSVLLGESTAKTRRRLSSGSMRASQRLASSLPHDRYRDFVRSGGSLAALGAAREGRAPLSVGQAARLVEILGSTALVEPSVIRR